jgi:hypothetical protein
MQATGVVLLNDKDAAATRAPDAPDRLRRLSEAPLLAILFK